MSWNIHFGTAKLVKDMNNKTNNKSLEQVVQAYHTRDSNYVPSLDMDSSNIYKN